MPLDLTHCTFGNLTVIARSEDYHSPNGNIMTQWLCKCKCGREIIVKRNYLRSGKITSCSSCSKIDLTGRIFGYLTVIGLSDTKKRKSHTQWLCKCSCGKEIIVDQNSLLSGHTKSCGCLKKKLLKERRQVDITGKHFGNWIVLYRDSTKSSYWVCQCICGTIKSIQGSSLKCGDSNSCGCEKRATHIKDISGKKFGKLTALYIDTEFKKIYSPSSTPWMCKCECGRESTVLYSNLVQGRSTQCGECSGLVSKKEIEIIDFIRTFYNGKVISSYRPIFNHKIELDIYIPDKNIAIEYNGSPFHSSLNSAYKDKSENYHFSKWYQCKENNIRLISIFDKDWIENKDRIKNLLESTIQDKDNIDTRDLLVKEITVDEAKSFYESTNSIELQDFPTINIALVNKNDNIIQCLGIDILKKDKYEIKINSTKSGYFVDKGFLKLLDVFSSKYKPSSIIVISDNDYSIGEDYSRLGFIFISYIKDYYWVKKSGSIFLSKFQIDLEILKNNNPDIIKRYYNSNKNMILEDYVLVELGYRKVYRCGKTVWSKEYYDV